VGNATFSKWKNVNVMKAKVFEPENPNTVNQQMRRSMFAFLVAAARALKPVSDLGFKAYSNVMSQFNAFVKFNYGGLASAGVAPNFVESLIDMVISKGTLTPTAIGSNVSVNASAIVTINFANITSAPDQAATDKAIAVAWNDTSGLIAYNVVGTDRSTGVVTVTMPAANVSGDSIYAYLFFMRADGSINSDSDALLTNTP